MELVRYLTIQLPKLSFFLVAGGTSTSALTLAGGTDAITSAAGVTISGVAAQALSPTSTYAVNGGQLYSVSTSLSTGLSTTNSNVASLSTSASSGVTSLSTGVSTAQSGVASLSTGLSTTNSSVTALSTSASSGVASLSTGV
ncbi:MAG: hypothetical protein HZC06_12645, partial [Methylocystis sp.]|nr:hypothetical protein [Methylocystis sp.]